MSRNHDALETRSGEERTRDLGAALKAQLARAAGLPGYAGRLSVEGFSGLAPSTLSTH